MSIKVVPVGTKILVKPIKKEETIMESGVIAVDFQLDTAEVVEVSSYLKEVYKPGDIVMYPSGAGVGHYYNKKGHCLFLNGQEFPQGDVWAILTEEKIKKDKGDSL